jgi:predicted nucleic acid-binding protein
MRVVVDTGVFISAAIKAQTIPNIAVYQAARRGVLLKSHLSEAELMEVIDRPYLARLIAPAARARLVELLNPFRGIPIVSPAVFVQGASRP